MRWNKIKTVLVGVVFAAFVMVTGAGVQAATVDDGKAMYYVGETIYKSRINELKINGKAPSKFKKKIKTVKTGRHVSSNTYWSKSHFDTTSAYATPQEYDKENGDQTKKYEPSTTDYTMTFKKPGTYKISWVVYRWAKYSRGEKHTDPISGKEIYDIKQYNPITNKNELVTTATYVSSGQQAEESFYQGANGMKYAYGSGEYVPVSLAKGADGKIHVRYTPEKMEKITYIKTYKVLATNNIVKSVKLGKVTNKNSTSLKEGGASTSLKKGKKLSGKSGKVVVSMADKNYKLTGIIARTYDADGEPIYTKVDNQKMVTFGTNAKQSGTTADSQWSTTMYKPTEIFVFYKNEFTGESTVINSQSKDAEGNTTYVITKTYTSKNPSTGKEVLLTSTYNITRKKPYKDYEGYRYYYTETYKDWNSSTNRYEDKTVSDYKYDLENFFENYKVTSFYQN